MSDAGAAAKSVSRWVGPLGAAALLGALVAALSLIGQGSNEAALGGLVTVVWLVMKAGSAAAAYLGAGAGVGRVAIWALGGCGNSTPASGPGAGEGTGPSAWLQLGLGVAAMLWLSHLLGMLGFLSGPGGRWVAWGVVASGLALLIDQVLRGSLRPERWPVIPPWVMLAVPGIAVTLVAACNPPGSLWLGARSEAGGYDAMSYHLELPKEWAAGPSGSGLLGAGRLWALEHNVYSFLPGAMEGAYLHIAAMSGAGRADGGNFVAGDGTGVIACQMLHLGMGIVCAMLLGRTVWVFLRRAVPGSAARAGAMIAAATAVSIPWVVVVGSLAYNELAVCAMLACGVLACVEGGLSPMVRGIAAGFAAGMACSAKPTTLFMGAPVVGLVLLWSVPRRDLMRAVLAGWAAGGAAIAPWLVRNWLAAGNPVFPFGAGVLGKAHWTAEQVARYSAAHRFDGGVPARLAALFSPDRGVRHEQWAIFLPAGLVALVIVAAWKPTRALGLVLLGGVATQVAGWLFLTHLQPRFLLPLVVPMVIGVGLAVGVLGAWVGGRSAAARAGVPIVATLLPACLAVWSVTIFLGQRDGSPNALLVAGPAGMTGQAFAPDFATAGPTQQREVLENFASPPIYVNFTFEPGDRLYLLGDATPLYFLPGGAPFAGAVLYHTTWDRSPLGEAMRAHPDDAAAWTAVVREAMQGGSGKRGRGGGDFVLANLDELRRLCLKDHWYDPAVTPDLVRRWLTAEAQLVRAWPTGPESGVYLYRLKAPAQGGGGGR
jgi:hypothetical protein